jgi:hypothetical protein
MSNMYSAGKSKQLNEIYDGIVGWAEQADEGKSCAENEDATKNPTTKQSKFFPVRKKSFFRLVSYKDSAANRKLSVKERAEIRDTVREHFAASKPVAYRLGFVMAVKVSLFSHV